MIATKRLVLLLIVLAPVATARAAVDCSVREPELTHVCQGGANDGAPCDPDVSALPDPLQCSAKRPALNDGCPGGTCVIDFLKGTSFHGILTLVVDENVSKVDGSTPSVGNVVAVTVLLDLGKLGTLAQTYQSLDSTNVEDLALAPTDSFGVPVSENLLRLQAQEVDGKERIVNDLVFRSNEEEMATALRTLLGLGAGKPVVTKVSSVRFTDGPTTLGSVLRVKIKGAFVNQ